MCKSYTKACFKFGGFVTVWSSRKAEYNTKTENQTNLRQLFQLHFFPPTVLRPFLESMPILGGIQIFMISPPDINFTFTGLAKVVNCESFASTLRKVISDEICAMLKLHHNIYDNASGPRPPFDPKKRKKSFLPIHSCGPCNCNVSCSNTYVFRYQTSARNAPVT